MQTEFKLTKTELRKISLEFRTKASRLLKTTLKEGISNLKRFIFYIENEPIISSFIKKNNIYTFDDIDLIIDYYDNVGCSLNIPDNSESREISFVYQLLKATANKYDNSYDGYFTLARYYPGDKYQQKVENFNKSVVSPFVNYISNYLTNLQIDMGDDDQTKVSIEVHGDNYGNMMPETNIDQSKSSIGIGVNQNSDIKTEKLAGTINEASHKNIAEVAAEIQQLLEQLSQTYPTSTSKEKTILVAEAVDQIEHNPTLKTKFINALKAGETEVFKGVIDHPVINILLASVEGWKEIE